MNDNVLTHLSEALRVRKEEGRLRSLRSRGEGIDFYSNDYLGLATNIEFQETLFNALQNNPEMLRGATGSRLVSGSSEFTLSVEAHIALEHGVERALLFPSGYSANLALFSCLPQRQDTILVDELIHRSVLDGCRLSFAQKLRFLHNDLNHLEDRLKKARGKCWIAVESLYSMEGDLAPLSEMVSLAGRYGASLIVDEAHAMGVFGHGIVAGLGLYDHVLATVVTYGKAMGAHGAAILAKSPVADYLVNFAAPFIYTTALPDLHAMSILSSYEFLQSHAHLREDVQNRIRCFTSAGLPTLSSAASPIQAIPFSNIRQLMTAQAELEKNSLDTFAVRPPTVKSGSERLRISLHTFNTESQIQLLTALLKNINDTR